MQIICARNLVAMEENVIVSNDAIMRNLNFENINHIELISRWFRSLIYFHMAVNTWEKRHGYPGMRTVVAGGERLLHSFDDARFEDFIFNYTKKILRVKVHSLRRCETGLSCIALRHFK